MNDKPDEPAGRDRRRIQRPDNRPRKRCPICSRKTAIGGILCAPCGRGMYMATAATLPPKKDK